MVMIFGEVTTKASIDYEKVVRDAIAHIGYDSAAKGELDRREEIEQKEREWQWWHSVV